MKKIVQRVAISAGALVVCASTAFASPITRVNVMPDRQVRPGNALPVFGSADGGAGTHNADGSFYTWTFTFNPAFVSVAPSNVGPLGVTNDRNINFPQTFTLLGGSTRQIITATLTVANPGTGTSQSKSVKIDIVDPLDDSDQLSELQINVNIAIEDGLRAMYLAQTASGAWTGNDACGATGFSVWAFSNSGHRPTVNTHPTVDMSRDIYGEWVQKGINYILNANSTAVGFNDQPHIGTPDGDSPATLVPPTPPTVLNGVIISLCDGSGVVGYTNGIAAAAIESAYSAFPGDVHTSGPAHVLGKTYKQIIQDAIDWTAFAQNDDAGGIARGGWYYTANVGSGGDTSVESWEYVAQEGFESVFGGTVLENVKREAEIRLDWSQSTAAGSTYGQFSYGNACAGWPFPECGAAHVGHFSGTGNATTAGGISGLNMVTRGGRVPFYLNGAPYIGTFADVPARKAAAVANLGLHWNDSSAGSWRGNFGNFYAMWTQARALRLNGSPTLVNSGVTFDWQTGEDPLFPGVVPSAAPHRGYFNYLVATQLASGAWPAFSGGTTYSVDLDTAMAVLILQPRVFGAAGDCSAAAPSVPSLAYPLDHALRPVTITGVSGTVRIDAICQDENPNFEGIPAYSQDGDGLLSSTAQVRAEFSGTRAKPSNGRVYTIFFTATDAFCSGKVKVAMNTTPGGVPAAIDNSGTSVWNSVTGAASCPQVP